MLTITILFSLFITLAQTLPTSLKSRDVYDPPITSPTSSTVWTVGQTVTITWDTSVLPSNHSQVTDLIGMVLLGFITTPGGSENLNVDSPLASNFSIYDGNVSFTVPNVATRDDYIVVLFGDSGNASPLFTIQSASSSSSSSSSTSGASSSASSSSSSAGSASSSHSSSGSTSIMESTPTTVTTTSVTSDPASTVTATPPASVSISVSSVSGSEVSVTNVETSIVTVVPAASSTPSKLSGSSTSSTSHSSSASTSAPSGTAASNATQSNGAFPVLHGQTYGLIVATLFAVVCLL